MDQDIFSFNDYKSYLGAKSGDPGKRSGAKAAMAKAIRCQPTYISQVLHGNAHLSLEQVSDLNAHFGHSPDESKFFLLLAQRDRAGTNSLRRFFEDELKTMRSKRLVLTERLGKQGSLSEEQRARYYSSWHYAAIHVALTVPELRDRKALAEFFRLPLKKVATVLDFLSSMGLVKLGRDGAPEVGDVMIRVGTESAQVARHHANWRQYAIESLDREEPEDLHYSAVVSLSHADALKLKNRMLENLKKDVDFIRKSPEETLYCYTIDFFGMKRV